MGDPDILACRAALLFLTGDAGGAAKIAAECESACSWEAAIAAIAPEKRAAAAEKVVKDGASASRLASPVGSSQRWLSADAVRVIAICRAAREFSGGPAEIRRGMRRILAVEPGNEGIIRDYDAFGVAEIFQANGALKGNTQLLPLQQVLSAISRDPGHPLAAYGPELSHILGRAYAQQPGKEVAALAQFDLATGSDPKRLLHPDRALQRNHHARAPWAQGRGARPSPEY